jgi:hypothetical protein
LENLARGIDRFIFQDHRHIQLLRKPKVEWSESICHKVIKEKCFTRIRWNWNDEQGDESRPDWSWSAQLPKSWLSLKLRHSKSARWISLKIWDNYHSLWMSFDFVIEPAEKT